MRLRVIGNGGDKKAQSIVSFVDDEIRWVACGHEGRHMKDTIEGENWDMW